MSRSSIEDAKLRLSHETGTIIKDWGGRLPIALIYPNSYYIGMSSLGIQAIYSIINSYPNAVCERVFWDKTDKGKPAPPLSVESRRPLTDFAVIAFSISYELDYFNVVQILKAGGIPLYAKDRNETHPLIIAGGPCITANPMPLAPFFDCLCIGEAEPILPSLLPVLSEDISEKRDNLLNALAKLPGIYVPQVSQTYPITRQYATKLDDFPVHSVVLTPDTELGDLYLIEVERGCSWGCRFCMVSTHFSPMRYRSLDSLIAQSREGLKFRKRLGLVGPAVPDHPKFEELLAGLQGLGADLSIASLRIKPLPTIALQEMAKGGARTIALAPEAGCQRLRQVIKKNISEDDILKAMSKVAEQPGIDQLKLYFMIGLPSETDEDIEEMVRLTLECKAVLDRKRAGIRITLSIAPFVPKAGTPFQWLPMEQLTTLQRRFNLLKRALIPKGITPKAESLAWSQVQGILARGDSRLAEALAETEEVSLSGWQKALDKCGLDADSYLYRKWGTDEELPWAVVDSGIKPGQLEGELGRAVG
ncbi:MAG: radical SAM protein [Chloroflexi bacterium]|nr:radical SAM protein [Chloroflexota bacterium]